MTTVSATAQACPGVPNPADELAHSSSPVPEDMTATIARDDSSAGGVQQGFQHWIGQSPADAMAHGASRADALRKFGALFGMPPNVQRFYADPNGGASNPKQANPTNPPAGSIGSPTPPSLQEGKSSGPDVTNLQGQLNIWREHQWHEDGNLGYPTSGLALNGKFDANTREALKDFQRQVGLPVTGVADAATQKLLKLENDRSYSLMVSASNRALLRQLFASPGLDGARMDALVSLLTDSAFASRLTSGDQKLVGDTLVKTKGDKDVADGLRNLIASDEFHNLMPDQRSMILVYVRNHADARMVGNVLRMLKNEGDLGIMLNLAGKEWKADQAAAKPASVQGRNDTNTNRLSATGPIPAAAWSDPIQIVGRLTQNAEGVRGAYSSDRCGPTNLLAGALLQGTDVAAKYVEKSAANSGGFIAAGEKQEMLDIAGKIRSHTATFDDLSRVGDLLYRAANRRNSLDEWRHDNPGPWTLLNATQTTQLNRLLEKSPNYTPGELKQLSDLLSIAMDREVNVTTVNELGGKWTAINYRPGTGSDHDGLDVGELRKAATAGGLTSSGVAYDRQVSDPAGAVLARLKPGESAVLLLPGDPNGTHADHYVTIGILADGRPFIYNPDPAQGDATLTVGRAVEPQTDDFTNELARYSQRAKAQQEMTAATRIAY